MSAWISVGNRGEVEMSTKPSKRRGSSSLDRRESPEMKRAQAVATPGPDTHNLNERK